MISSSNNRLGCWENPPSPATGGRGEPSGWGGRGVWGSLLMYVYVCMDGWMDGWMCMYVYVWMDGWMDVCVCMCMYVYVWMDGWMYVYVCVCMCMYVYVCMDGWMDGWMCMYVYVWMDGWMDGWMYVYVCICMCMYVYVWMDGWMYVYVCVCMCMYVYEGVWMCMYVYVCVWMDVCLSVCMYVLYCIKKKEHLECLLRCYCIFVLAMYKSKRLIQSAGWVVRKKSGKTTQKQEQWTIYILTPYFRVLPPKPQSSAYSDSRRNTPAQSKCNENQWRWIWWIWWIWYSLTARFDSEMSRLQQRTRRA